MAFPSTPSAGTTATVGGRLYRYDGYAWTFAEGVSQHAVTHGVGGSDPVTLAASQVTGLSKVATTGSASDLSGGTVSATVLPAATTSSPGVVTIGQGLGVSSGTVSANVVSVAGRTGTVTIAAADVSGLSTIATSASASDLSGGTVSSGLLPVATSSTAGAVKVGDRLSISSGALGIASDTGTFSAYATASAFPATGVSGSRLYLSTDTGKVYEWASNAYVEVGPGAVLYAATVPSSPSNPSGTAGNGSVTLSWSVPSSAGTAPITSYPIQYSSDSGATWSNATAASGSGTSATVSGLTAATTYLLRVAAANAAGTGPYSNTVTATPSVAVPDAPSWGAGATGGYGTATELSLLLSLPAANGAPITQWSVQSKTSAVQNWATSTVSSDVPAFLITGLTENTSYIYRVAGINSAGTGAYSSEKTVYTGSSSINWASHVDWQSASAGNGVVTLRWNAPYKNSSLSTSGITQYQIVSTTTPEDVNSWRSAANVYPDYAGHTSPYPEPPLQVAVSGLTNGVKYWFRILAINSAGNFPSVWSVPISATPHV